MDAQNTDQMPQSDLGPPAPPGMSKKSLVIILVIVFVLSGISYGGIWWWIQKSSNIVIPTFTPRPAKVDLDVKTYQSDKLGIQFSYLASRGAPIIEEESKVFVGGSKGQSVEIFNKDPKITIEEAIRAQFLKNYSDKICYVEIITNTFKNANKDLIFAEIAYPIIENGVDPWFSNFDKCPKYAKSNGIRYFMMDKNYPDRYTFFDIGQYGIPAESTPGDRLWQDTFKFTR